MTQLSSGPLCCWLPYKKKKRWQTCSIEGTSFLSFFFFFPSSYWAQGLHQEVGYKKPVKPTVATLLYQSGRSDRRDTQGARRRTAQPGEWGSTAVLAVQRFECFSFKNVVSFLCCRSKICSWFLSHSTRPGTTKTELVLFCGEAVSRDLFLACVVRNFLFIAWFNIHFFHLALLQLSNLLWVCTNSFKFEYISLH